MGAGSEQREYAALVLAEPMPVAHEMPSSACVVVQVADTIGCMDSGLLPVTFKTKNCHVVSPVSTVLLLVLKAVDSEFDGRLIRWCGICLNFGMNYSSGALVGSANTIFMGTCQGRETRRAAVSESKAIQQGRSDLASANGKFFFLRRTR